jgi:signal transduction histidine kinase
LILDERSPGAGRRLVEILLVALLYHAGARLGFALQSIGTNTSPVWPPSGIGFAALLIIGRGAWPGVFVGALTANVAGFVGGQGLGIAGSASIASFIAVGNTLEAAVGVTLLRRFVTRGDPFQRDRDMWGFFAVVGVCCALAASNGALTVCAGALAPWADFWTIWFTWWLGDATGVLVIGSLLVVWARPFTLPRKVGWWVEALLIGVAFLLVCSVTFGVPVQTRASSLPLTFALLPLFVWCAYRFEHRGATLAIAAASSFSVWATYAGFGPFVLERLNDSLLVLQGFIGVVAITSLMLATVVKERRDAVEAIRESQEFLLQSRKMEAVGRLAGGIAHDFNNLLMVITGHADLIDLGADSTARHDHVQRIQSAVKRGATLVKQLLAYGRKQKLEPTPLDLSELVGDVGQLLQRVLGERVELKLRRPQGALTIHADPGNIERVLLNLSINARDAMPGGGTLTIETRAVDLAPAQTRKWELDPGRYALVSVADTGTGMDDHVRSRIFDPFYSTKEAASGTGLGLATVYGIVRQSGGHIDVESSPGAGSTFLVYLPLPDELDALIDPGKIRTDPGRRKRACGTILLAEDDDDVRGLITAILSGNGYKVLVARTGEEARDLFLAVRDKLVAVVTDVVMPGMSGYELAGWIRERDGAVPILFVSGYSDELAEGQDTVPGSLYLQKPFSARALLDRLGELLGD